MARKTGTEKRNIFTEATTVRAKETETPKEKNKEKETIEIGEELDKLSAIREVINQLKSVETDYLKTVHFRVLNKFINKTIKCRKRPDNFRGLGIISEASCELKVRAYTSALTEQDIITLNEYGIEYSDKVVTEAVPEQYYFNPKLMVDPVIANKISKALEAIPELKNKDILFHQEAREEVTVPVATSESFESVANKIDTLSRGDLRTIYSIIATLAVRPKLNSPEISLKKLMNILRQDGLEL